MMFIICWVLMLLIVIDSCRDGDYCNVVINWVVWFGRKILLDVWNVCFCWLSIMGGREICLFGGWVIISVVNLIGDKKSFIVLGFGDLFYIWLFLLGNLFMFEYIILVFCFLFYLVCIFFVFGFEILDFCLIDILLLLF